MNQMIKFTLLLMLLLPVFMHNALAMDNGSEPKHEKWDEWVENEMNIHPDSSVAESTVVQNRQISKTKRFQLIASGLGSADRNDLYSHYYLSVSSRYHFTELHAWEWIRFYTVFSQPTRLYQEAVTQVSYTSDVQHSSYQLVTSYVFTPIYGKYAWSDVAIVYFDIFATLGAGFRFANTTQFVFESGIGMNHYVFKKKLSLVPEYRIRLYSEQRTKATAVTEHLVQLGIAWLL